MPRSVVVFVVRDDSRVAAFLYQQPVTTYEAYNDYPNNGTTGKSLHFYQEPRAIQFRWAVWWRHRRRFNVAFDAPYATFTGLAAVPPGALERPA